MRGRVMMLMALTAILSYAAVGQTAGSDYTTLYKAARSCYETRRFEACDSLLRELTNHKLKHLQRRKVSQLMMDNAYHSNSQDIFFRALDSRFVKRNLDRSDYKYWRSLSLIPAPGVVWPGETVSLPLRLIGPEGHRQYGIDVMGNGRPLVGMIDNCCADYCSISVSLAEQLGVRPIGKTVHANGNRKATSYIGVLDTLSIGGLVLSNVLVDVSDNLESVKQTHPFDIIIGENVLTRTGEMTIDNETGTAVFSREGQDLPRNVSWHYPAHTFSVNASLNGNDVSMLLDLGNTNSYLNDLYYSHFPTDGSYVAGTLTSVTMDRTLTTKVYLIPKAGISFCGSSCELTDVPILLEKHSSDNLDGNLGMDAFLHFRRVVFNPDKLYLQLVP